MMPMTLDEYRQLAVLPLTLMHCPVCGKFIPVRFGQFDDHQCGGKRCAAPAAKK